MYYHKNLSAGHLETLVNGEVILKSGHTTSQLVCDNRFEYKFQDKVDDTLILFETKSVLEFEKYFVFTMYGGTIYYNFYQTPTLIMCPTPACTKSSGYDYTVYMLRIPENTYRLGLEGYDENNYQSISLTLAPKCYGFTNYYFWNPDGRFDSIHCTGNNNIVDVITKKGIQVGDKYVYSDIQIQKQIKQNTGFELNQNQVYGLIESPKVLNIIETEDELHKTSIINDTSNWIITTDWVYNSTNHTWSATNSNYSYLLSPVISTADYGYTFRMKFTSRFDNSQNYVVEIYDTDTLDSIDIKYITTVNNEFTFTCPSEVVHFTISFYGLFPTSGNIELNGITLWTGSTSLSDTTKNPYENINLLPNSYINETSDVYGFGLLDNIYLIYGQTYTLSANGYISDQSYAANEYMNVVISTPGGWDEQLSIYSSIPTTKSVTFNAPSTGYYQIQTYQSISSAVGEVHIEWYKLELGNESTPYTGSIDEYIPTSKLYNIDTTTFEGYNGLKLPEKNIELKLTDTKNI